MNYGHLLKFGTSITPVHDTPEMAVSLAKRSEELGYDLVAFQDHPDQPELLDTWTLLSWVAAQTKRIHIAATALNVPMRPPAVLAHAAASLDLLSAGRLDLALGAGQSWNEIEAMGGLRLTQSEAADVLNEAMEVVRGLLAGSTRMPLRFRGNYYQLAGAQRGPVSAHDIPIWLEGTQLSVLRLVGQQADGWLTSIGSMKAGEFQAAHKIIDEAAIKAGRDPRELRRLVNISGEFLSAHEGFLRGPSKQWVDDLLPLVVEDGVGTFILTSDDAETIEQFAREVIPVLREAVEHMRPDASGPVLRRASVRAKRHAGVDYDHVPASLVDAVIEPGDTGYARVKSTFLRGGSPGIVFQVKDTSQIIDAIAFARAHANLPLSVRSGGHGISGRSTNHGGIVIDLSQMNTIEILDKATRRVRIGPGARWMDVATALAPHGWALSSGDYGGVGVGGLATAAGVGWFAREHGLTIDHIRAVDMVLADGSVVHADAKENTDLFWAVRGAGANFGIVTSFEFEVDETGPVGWAQLVLDASDTAHFIEKWGATIEASPRDITSALIIGPARGGQPVVAQVTAVIDSDKPDTIINRLQPIANIAPLYDQQVVITSYADLIANAQGNEHNGQGEPVSRSGLVDHITPAFAAAATRLIRSGEVHLFHIRSVGGAVSDVDPDATAYGNRSASFSVVAFGARRARLDALWDEMAVHFKGLYLNFETDLRPERLNDAFPPRTIERLRTLKAHYDPENVFRDNFNIAPQTLIV
ncbi:LLM class flavin-dependent oxidoreductase [Dictyobacter formicarum]|uniref:FAD-binding PCMH-type domain-containing protein n=1 Tax=Dictyobacter formicarum TaxID=2778368 RepID=A0ABQ3VP08_9CHLR|nr:LLM class flavin-dependent oxidoreductase [Dictyobacter formicarum]GHO87131.1 hypothetical protein KSZ_51370 [Dictyobacter formicarum]